MIATSRQSASRAIVPAIRKTLWHARTTQASLRSSARVYFHQPPASVFCFVGEHIDEFRPSCVLDGLRQHSAGKPLHIQIFDGDETVLVDQLARCLVLEVAPLVFHMHMRALKQSNRLAAPGAPFLPPGDLPLSAPQPGLRPAVMPRIRNLGAIGQHRKAVQANVDTGCAVAGREHRSLPFDAEDREPAAGLALDRDRLDFAINYYDQANQLKAMRADGCLTLTNFSCCQDVLRRVDKTYKAFFARVKRGEKPGFPRYRSAWRYDSITFPSYGDGCRLLDNGKLRIQGAGHIKVKLHRLLEAKTNC